MTTINWNGTSAQSVSYHAGDSINITGVSANSLTFTQAAGSLTFASQTGALSLLSPSAALDDLAGLTFSFADGSKFQYVTSTSYFSSGATNDLMIGNDVGNNFSAGSGNDAVFSQGGNDSVAGGDGNDFIDGGNGDDILSGGVGNDTLIGGNGNDTLFGSDGDDYIVGGNGDDYLYGGDGNNILDGGTGKETLIGGTGNDTFYVRSLETTISDAGGEDTVHVFVNGFKVPQTFENVIYENGAAAIPYYVDALTHGTSWSAIPVQSIVIKYGFLTESSESSFIGFSDADIAVAEKALALYSAISGLKFERTTDLAEAKIRFGFFELGGNVAGEANYPSTTFSTVKIDDSYSGGVLKATNPTGFSTLVHEIGHALGLKHPGAYFGESNEDAGPFLPGVEDMLSNSQMSYIGNVAGNIFYTSGQWATLRPFDVAAIQYLYGGNPLVNAGATSYHFEKLAWPNTLISDGEGVDTLDCSGVPVQAGGMVIDLRQGYRSYVGAQQELISAKGQVSINFGTDIENAIGSQMVDLIYGNGMNNSLAGGLGNDTIDGGDGNDTIDGGLGNDNINGGNGIDTDVVLAVRLNVIVQAVADGYSVTSGGETDLLTGVEFIQFSDSLMAIGKLLLAAPTIVTTIESNGYVKGAVPVFSGVSVPNATISIFNGIVILGSATTDDAGAYSFTPSTQLVDGRYSVRAQVMDSSGNSSAGSDIVSFAVDTHAPNAPTIVQPSKNAAGFVIGNSPAISGTAEAGATVVVKNGGSVIGTVVADTGGAWSLTKSVFADGSYILNAKATDLAGNTSTTSSTYTFKVDTHAPSSPSAHVDIDVTGFLIGNQAVVTGFAEVGSVVEIVQGSSVLGRANVGVTGAYSLTSDPIGNGDCSIGVRDSDGAGNSALSEVISFKINSSLNKVGTAKDDVMHGSSANEFVDGGDGIDVFVVNAASTNYTMSQSADGHVKLLDKLGVDGTDVLANIERLQFSDKSVAFDINGTGGQAYRVYQAAFDRAPDLGGLGFWIAQMDHGTTLHDVANGFMQSDEFKTLYGISPSDEQFVTKLYNNVLHRPYEQAGFDFWIGGLKAGVPRADVLAAFSTSDENQAQVIGSIEHGFDFIPYA